MTSPLLVTVRWVRHPDNKVAKAEASKHLAKIPDFMRLIDSQTKQNTVAKGKQNPSVFLSLDVSSKQANGGANGRERGRLTGGVIAGGGNLEGGAVDLSTGSGDKAAKLGST